MLRPQPTTVDWGTNINVSRETIARMRARARARPRAPHLRWYRGLVPKCVG